MNVSVDKKKCISCGACISICPDVFEFGDDGKSAVKKGANLESDDIEAAKSACPVSAISVKK